MSNLTKGGGNKPQRHKNPGNIKYSKAVDHLVQRGADGLPLADQEGHLIFKTLEDGWEAFEIDISAKQKGGDASWVPEGASLETLGRGVGEMEHGYAEDPLWAGKVAQILGVPITTPINQIPLAELTRAIARQEGFYADGGGEDKMATKEKKHGVIREGSTLDKWMTQFDDFIEGLSLGEPLSEEERKQKTLDQLKWNQQRGLFGFGKDEVAKAEKALEAAKPAKPAEMLPKAEGPAKEDAGTWTQGYTKAPAKSRRPGLSGTLDMGDAGAPRQDSAFTALQDENAQLKADLAEARAIASPPPGAQGAVSGTGMATEAGPAAPPPAAGATPPPPPSPHATGAFGSMVPKANTMMLGNPADAASKAIAAGNQEDAARGGGNRGLMAALSGALSGAKDAVGGVAGAVGGALSAAGGGPADPNDMPLKPEHQGKTNRELAALKRMGVDIYQRTPQFPIRGRGGL